MIFPYLELENIVQTQDKTRLSGEKTFVSIDESPITLIEIEPEAGAGFIDVTSKKYLDWQFAMDGTKAVTIRVTTDGAPVTASKNITVLTPAQDKLFSSDSDLTPYEPKILEYVKAGRNSFLNVHRAAQDRIFSILDENGFWDSEGNKLDKDDVTNIEEFKDWSKFMVLRFIFESISNATDDIFHKKAERYRVMENAAQDRRLIRIDRTNDGDNEDDKDNFDFRSSIMVKS